MVVMTKGSKDQVKRATKLVDNGGVERCGRGHEVVGSRGVHLIIDGECPCEARSYGHSTCYHVIAVEIFEQRRAARIAELEGEIEELEDTKTELIEELEVVSDHQRFVRRQLHEIEKEAS